MNILVKKCLTLGFVVCPVFLAIAPLGLGIAFIEFLKPVLDPGVRLLRLLWENTPDPLYWILALVLNGLVYSAFFYAVMFVKRYMKNGSGNL